MAAFKFTKRATRDISEIWEYSAELWSEQQADKYYLILIEACIQLAKNPGRGRDYSDIRPGLLGEKISKHIIFYRGINKSTIEVTRILHERMDLRARLTE